MEQNNDHIYFNEAWNVKEDKEKSIKDRTLEELHKAMMEDKEEQQQRDEDGGYWSL